MTHTSDGSGAVKVSCPAPFDWTSVLAFLRARAIPGVEQIDGNAYRRTIRRGDRTGTLSITHDEPSAALLVTGRGLQSDATGAAATRVRWMFDLDADLPVINAHLALD